MRNLTLLGRETLGCPAGTSSRIRGLPPLGCKIQAVTVNPINGDVHVAGIEATHTKNGTVKVWVWNQLPVDCYSSNESSAEESSYAEQPCYSPSTVTLPATPCPFGKASSSKQKLPPRSSLLFQGEVDHEAEIISLQFLNDGGSLTENGPALCLITAGGDILLGRIPTEEDIEPNEAMPSMHLEVVGSIEQGIYAAAWSPDEELLVIVTAPTWIEEENRWEGEKTLVMTREFEALSEKGLSTDEFGEG